MAVDMAIIGGTGLYEPGLVQNPRQVKLDTPYGAPSSMVTVGELAGKRVAFLFRHGQDAHRIPPHQINYRANISALKQLGVTRILSPCAVGSLQDHIRPGELVIVDQFIDATRSRKATFYDGPQVCHISVADPTCRNLNALLIDAGRAHGLTIHKTGTYVCIEGPRFSTRAESRLFRSWGADVIGMTMATEAALAREAEICYAGIAMVTDYDTFREEAVSIEGVLAVMKQNTEKVKSLLMAVIPQVPGERTCGCKDALKGALI